MGKASTKAQNKYISKTYDRINLFVQKGDKELYKAAADAVGQSLNAWIVDAMEEKLRQGRP